MPRVSFSTRLIVAAAVLLACQGATAQDEQPRPAGLVRIDLPHAGDADTRLRGRIERVAQRLLDEATGDQRPVLVLEFRAPDGSTGNTPFERALGLARFLVDDRMAGVRTVAFIPETLDGHAVLVALACEELAVGPDVEFGAAASGEDASKPIELGIRASYEQIASTRQGIPRAAVIAMVDRQAQLVRAETDAGLQLLLADQLEEMAEEAPIGATEVLSPAGALASFTGREARAEGISQYLAADRETLARALGLSTGSLLEDRSFAEDWRPIMIDIAGPITYRSVRRFETLLADEIAPGGANWVGLRIDSEGGDVDAGLRLAQTLAELDENEVRTVAYVPRRATGVAALAALACDQLVMQTGSELSGATETLDVPQGALAVVEKNQGEAADDAAPAGDKANADAAPAKDPAARPLGADPPRQDAAADRAGLDPVIKTLRGSLAETAGRGWSLLAATIDPSVRLVRYTHRETGEARVMSPAEVADQPDAAAWAEGQSIKAAGEPLSLSVTEAVRLRVAWREVDQIDELVTLYGFDAIPRTAEPNWAIELVEALASPGLAALLLVVGVVGLYIELSTPGLGIGGFIAAVAFLLFFWSKFLDGTADWLEVLLFVTGVVFVLLEVVVLPGFGVFGLGGGAMIVAALVLAGQTFLVPKTPTQLDELRSSLGVVAGAGVACIVAGLVLRQYLPQSPLFRRAMLMPPEEADRIEQSRREALADYSYLVGARGVALADLLPGGRAEFDGRSVDVIAQGDIIEKGDSVEVVSTHGSRVIVRRVVG